VRLLVRADGASRGNPGVASYGAVIYDEHGTLLAEIGEAIGIATNNHAEYRGVIAALEYIAEHYPDAELRIELDSNLVIQQLSGNWKVKHPDLQPLVKRASELLAGTTVSLQWIPREQNSAADAAANRALDTGSFISQQLGGGPRAAESLAEVQPRSIRAPRVKSVHTDFYLVRHGSTGQTEANRISGGGEDPDLSDRGRLEARSVAEGVERLSQRFGLAMPSAVVHSPLRRTTGTARLLADPYGLDLRPDSRLREIEFGDWEGLSNASLEEMPETRAWRGSLTVSPPGGESLLELRERVSEAFFELVDAHAGQALAVVSHMMPTRTILAIALGGLDHHFWSLQVAPASISVLRVFGRDGFEIYTVNSCEHLPLH
jgi:ribonuclease H / adenosylcobalamin/alpha-ribazole phosphatase